MKGVNGGSVRIRQLNRETIKNALASSGPGTKAALAEVTGLSVPTCANILADLMRTGEVVALEERESQGGRPARVYAVNPAHSMSAAIIVGANGGREYYAYTVVDSLGTVAAEGGEQRKKIDAGAIADLLRDLRRSFPALKSAALSVPAVVRDGNLNFCDIPALENVPLENMLRKRCGIEVAVENDMNLAAIGYYRKQCGSPGSSLAYLVFPSDHCPGGGIISGGRLIKGRSAFAGEVSFIPVPGNGRNRKYPGGRKFLAIVADIAASIIAIVNPDVVALTGDRIVDGAVETIRDMCGQTIPAEHLPEFVHRPECSGDRLAGTIEMAMNLISLDIRLVKRKRTWCDNE